MAATKETKSDAAGGKKVSAVMRPALTIKERYAAGKALRQNCPRDVHAVWLARAGRPDPVELVLAAEKGRVPDLLPLS